MIVSNSEGDSSFLTWMQLRCVRVVRNQSLRKQRLNACFRIFLYVNVKTNGLLLM